MDERDTPVDTSARGAQGAASDAQPPKGDPKKKPAEAWCALKGTDKHLFAGARASWKWVVGWELTEQDYDAAVKAAGEVEAR